MFKIALLFACVTLSLGMVRRDAPAPAPEQDIFADIAKHAAEFQKTFSEQLNAVVNSKSTQEATKTLQEGSDSVLQQLSKLSASLNSAVTDANGKAKEALQKAQQDLSKTISELKKEHPEVEQNATALKEKINAAVQQGLEVSKNVAKQISEQAEAANQKLAPKFQEAVNDFTKQAQEIQKKIHDAASKQ